MRVAGGLRRGLRMNALEAMGLFADARISVSSTVTLLLPYRELRDNR